MAVAAVGTFAVAAGAGDERRAGYVVARDDLVVGHRITADDVALAPVDAPPFVAERAFRRAEDVVGAVVVGPVGRGELVQAASVLRGAPEGRQVSFPVEAARALDGNLQPGDRLLADAWGRPPTARETDPYWRALVAANRSGLVDPGNPDLLLPGQVLAVPPPPARAA